jgi:MoaA/NifB/PqqE/SkfB family radical SAM enzyme
MKAPLSDFSSQKSEFPYLVDLNISNFCPYGCEFCYTSSTKKGKHTDFYDVYKILEALKSLRVFEVVFGGGEPTLHPQIYSIVQKAKELNFVVGLTTRNYKFNSHPAFNKILENLNSIAISCNTVGDLNKIVKLKNDIDKDRNRHFQLYVQNILGLSPFEELLDFFKTCWERYIYNVTLLGYKDFGFGKNQKAHEGPKDWLQQIQRVYRGNLGVDSIIAKKYKQYLVDSSVMPYCLVGDEGKQTCYIDTTKKIIKPSSFVDDDKGKSYEKVKYGGLEEFVIGAFKKF